LADLDKRKRIVVVCGPTASGKSGLAVALSKRLNGEIISADSMQIYRGLDIGTAKVTEEEMQGVPHHLLDICDPSESYSVAEFVQQANSCIEQIEEKGRLPILCGGTGLYISSLLAGVQFVEHPATPDLRAQLEQEAAQKGNEAMWQQLQLVDPYSAAAIHPNNIKRVLRALEIYRQTGLTMTQQAAQSLPDCPPYNALVLGLTCRDRQKLYDRIDTRFDSMIQCGLLEEARQVLFHRESWVTAAQAIGYKEFFPYLLGESSLTECTEQAKRASRRYAKRQLTWFNRVPDICWLYTDEQENLLTSALKKVENWIENSLKN